MLITMSTAHPIPEDTRERIVTPANGVTSITVPFYFQQNADIGVWRRPDANAGWTLFTEGVNYTLTGAGVNSGGTVTLAVAGNGTAQYRVRGDTKLDRLGSVTQGATVKGTLLDAEFDRTRLIQQEQRRDIYSNAENIAAEVANRQAAVTAEAATRLAADVALGERIDLIDGAAAIAASLIAIAKADEASDDADSAASSANSAATSASTAASASALAGSFLTRTAMDAAVAGFANGQRVEVTADGINNGSWVKTGGVFVQRPDIPTNAYLASLIDVSFGNVPGRAYVETSADGAATFLGINDVSGEHEFDVPMQPDNIAGVTIDEHIPFVSLAVLAENDDKVFEYWTDLGEYENPNEDDEEGAAGTAISASFGAFWIVDRNHVHNQWITPLGVEDAEGSLYMGSVGSALSATGKGPIQVAKATAGDAPRRRVLGYEANVVRPGGSASTVRLDKDDHDASAVLLNPKPGAAQPLITMQTEHNGLTYLRAWAAPDKNIDNLAALPNISFGYVLSYTQITQNASGDGGLIVYSRRNGHSGPWALRYRDNESDTSWAGSDTFVGGYGVYFFPRPCADASGHWLWLYGNPADAVDMGTDQTIRIAKVTNGFALTNVTGTTIKADIRTGAAVDPTGVHDGSWTDIRQPGGKALRLWDGFDFGSTLVTGWSEWDGLSLYSPGNYMVAYTDPGTGATTVETACPCGGKIDEYRPDNASYGGGMAFISASAFVACRIWPDGSDVVICERIGANDWRTTVIARSPLKYCRPEAMLHTEWDVANSKIVYSRSSRIMLLHGRYYDFVDCNFDRLIFDADQYRTI